MERKCSGVLVKEVELGVIIAAEVHSVLLWADPLRGCYKESRYTLNGDRI